MQKVLMNNRKVGVMGALLTLSMGLMACGTTPAPAAPATGGVTADTRQIGPDDAWQDNGTSLKEQALSAGDNSLTAQGWLTATNGWGPVETNRSNGEQAAGDGKTLTLNGQTYAQGFGTNANSSISFNLDGRCTTFTSDIGVDDEVGSKGSVIFQVYADGAKVYDSGKMTGASATKRVSVSVAGKKELKLVVDGAGDGFNYDHADWAAPKVSCLTQQSLSDLTPVSATNGWGPVETNRSNGEQAAGDGRALTIAGTAYTKGLGVHAASQLVYGLNGTCNTFAASVGVDDEVGDRGSVIFQVFADGIKLYDSGIVRGTDGAKPLSVNVAGVKELKLVATDAGDGTGYDHADWVNPLVTCSTPLVSPTPTVAPAPTVASVSVSPASLSLTSGGTSQLTASVDAQNGASSGVTWSSSNSGAATVDAAGKVTAVAAGTATITATSTFDTSKKGSVSVTVQAPAPAPAPAPTGYSAPITITKGGTYSGNWENTGTGAAVVIQTTEPVIIENSNLRSRGPLITGWNLNLTVRNVRGESLTPNISGRAAEMAIKVEELRNLRVENSSFTGGGIYVRKFLGDAAAGQGIRILKNTFSNIDGRLSNGAGGLSGGTNIRQAIQFNDVTKIPTAEIAWNQVINEPNKSFVEDNFNFFGSSGVPGSPILVHDNYIQGGYPVNPGTNSSYSGGGIMMGDALSTDPTMNGYVRVEGNQVVSTTNYGIAIAGGYGNQALNNRVISSGRLPDGSRIAAQNVGIYVWDMYGAGSAFGGHLLTGNVAGWTRVNTDGAVWANSYWCPDGAKNGSVNEPNTNIGAVTLDAEKAEFTRWQQKLAAAGVVIGAK